QEASAARRRSAAAQRTGLAAGSKDGGCRLTFVRLVCVEQCRLVDLGDRIRDRFVHTGTHPRFGTQVAPVQRKANLARRPFDAGIEGSRTLRNGDVQVRVFDSRLRRIRLSRRAHCYQAAGKSAEDGGRNSAAKAEGSGHGGHGDLPWCRNELVERLVPRWPAWLSAKSILFAASSIQTRSGDRTRHP